MNNTDASPTPYWPTDSSDEAQRSPNRDHQPRIAELDRLHAELAAAHTQIANLKIALESSREIGAAIGILMNRCRVSYEQAFDILREASQRTHRKLREVAADLVYTGSLDEPR